MGWDAMFKTINFTSPGNSGMVQFYGTLAQLVQSAALTEQRSLVRAQYVPPARRRANEGGLSVSKNSCGRSKRRMRVHSLPAGDPPAHGCIARGILLIWYDRKIQPEYRPVLCRIDLAAASAGARGIHL